MSVWLICFIVFWPVLGCLCFVLGAEALVKGQISNDKAWGKKIFIIVRTVYLSVIIGNKEITYYYVISLFLAF